MSQDQLQLLLLKIVLVSGAVSVAVFVAIYHLLTRGAVWRDEVGKTIIIKDILLFACLAPTILSLFFEFSRLTSRVSAWIDIVLFGLLTPIMIWRSLIWIRLARRARATRADADGGQHAEGAGVPGTAAAPPAPDREGAP